MKMKKLQLVIFYSFTAAKLNEPQIDYGSASCIEQRNASIASAKANITLNPAKYYMSYCERMFGCAIIFLQIVQDICSYLLDAIMKRRRGEAYADEHDEHDGRDEHDDRNEHDERRGCGAHGEHDEHGAYKQLQDGS